MPPMRRHADNQGLYKFSVTTLGRVDERGVAFVVCMRQVFIYNARQQVLFSNLDVTLFDRVEECGHAIAIRMQYVIVRHAEEI